MTEAMNLTAAERGADAGDLEARVAARTEELSSLSTHLLRMMESERSQLARELHDELGGLITAAKMDMAWLQAHIGNSLDAASEEKFRSVVQMLNQAMTLKRRVVESLRPSLLDHFGLPVASATDPVSLTIRRGKTEVLKEETVLPNPSGVRIVVPTP